MVEETTAAAHSLSQQTDDLAQLISRFRIDANAVYNAARRFDEKACARGVKPRGPRRLMRLIDADRIG